jgi:hypothetical protein
MSGSPSRVGILEIERNFGQISSFLVGGVVAKARHVFRSGVFDSFCGPLSEESRW